jgi:drug/metabolite transporter (DMT)-like permease
MFYLAIALTVVANVVYHLAQRSIPRDVNPLASLLATYVVAIAATLVLMPFFPGEGNFRSSWKKLNWASYAIGLAIVAIELGFLLAYRAGWRISVAAVTSNAAVALMLVPIGLFAFRDRLSAVNAAGFVLCLLGLVLLSIR